MLIKATCLHPGVLSQVYRVGMVVKEVVVKGGMVEVESVVVVLKVAVVDMSVAVVVESDIVISVGMVFKAIVAAIAALAI